MNGVKVKNVAKRRKYLIGKTLRNIGKLIFIYIN